MQEFVKRRASHNTIKPITVLNLNKSIHQETKMACKFISGVLFRPRKDGKDTSSDAIRDSKITERLISNTEKDPMNSNEVKISCYTESSRKGAKLSIYGSPVAETSEITRIQD